MRTSSAARTIFFVFSFSLTVSVFFAAHMTRRVAECFCNYSIYFL